MKGQTQSLTAVLITTVTIGAIAAGYTWGTPLLEKRQSQVTLNNVEKSTIELYSAINSVSTSAEGSARKITLDPKEGSIKVNDKLDYIQVTTISENSPYPKGVWKLLRGSSLQNLSFGAGAYASRKKDTLGVVGVTSSSGARETIRYRIEFRNLLTQRGIRRVDLKPIGNPKSIDKTQIIVRNAGQRIDYNYIAGNEPYTRYRTVIEVDLQ